MALRKASNITKIYSLFLFVVLGLAALTVFIQGSSRNTESRSKAAESEVVFKQWEFNGSTTEGWTGSGNTTWKTQNSWLVGNWFLPKKTQLTNTTVSTTLPIGIKMMKTQLALMVGSGTISQTQQGSSGVARPINSPSPQKYTVEIKYKIAAQDGWQKTLQTEVVGDGQFREYTLTFPEALTESTVTTLQFNFPAFPPGTQIKIDSIRLVSTITRTSVPGKKPGTSSEVTKEGVVERDNLEGVSPFKLMVSASEAYRLVSNQEEVTRPGMPSGKETWSGSLDDYVGKRVQVSGTLTQPSSNSGRIGIPTSSMPTLTVRTIVVTGVSSSMEPIPGNSTPVPTPTTGTPSRFRFYPGKR